MEPAHLKSAEVTQRQYYARTASEYEQMHAGDAGIHYRALSLMGSLAEQWGIRTILDIGTGTGRALRYLHEHGFQVRGVEPVAELIEAGATQWPPLRNMVAIGVGQSLPFADESIDAVCEFGVLHHVPNPAIVVAEMMRVARKAIFISDANRFGQGPKALRWMKLGLWSVGLWRHVNLIRTSGKGYTISEGDGLAYSYSVFDNYKAIRNWAEATYAIPTVPADSYPAVPTILSSAHLLVIGVKAKKECAGQL